MSNKMVLDERHCYSSDTVQHLYWALKFCHGSRFNNRAGNLQQHTCLHKPGTVHFIQRPHLKQRENLLWCHFSFDITGKLLLLGKQEDNPCFLDFWLGCNFSVVVSYPGVPLKKLSRYRYFGHSTCTITVITVHYIYRAMVELSVWW